MSRPGRLSQSKTCETTSVPAYCFVCSPWPRAYAFHAMRRSESPGWNARRPAKSSSPCALVLRAAGIGFDVMGGAQSARAPGAARRSPSSPDARRPRRGTGRADAASRRRNARARTRPAALARHAQARPAPRRRGGTSASAPRRARGRAPARAPGAPSRDAFSQQQAVTARRLPANAGSASSSRTRSPASVPWQ